METLAGRKALVMGADKPVAAAVALALAEAGADVACTSTTGDPEEAFSLRGLRRRIEGFGRMALADIADLGNGSSVQIAVRQIAKQFGGLDLLVIAPHDPFSKAAERISDAEWTRALGFNLDAYFYACRAFAREVSASDANPKGRVVALLPDIATAEGTAVLQATRAGAEALIRALAHEWTPLGVLVNAIAVPFSDDETIHRRAAEETLRLGSTANTGELIQLA